MKEPTQTQEEQDKLAVEFYASGRKLAVEFWSETKLAWMDVIGDPLWERSVRYRRKPTKRTVPLGPYDVSPSDKFRAQRDSDVWFCAISAKHEKGISVHIWCLEKLGWISWSCLQRSYEFSRDNGKTWSRCEKEVES